MAGDRCGVRSPYSARRRWLWQQQFEQRNERRDGGKPDQLDQLGELELGLEHRVEWHVVLRSQAGSEDLASLARRRVSDPLMTIPGQLLTVGRWITVARPS